MYKRGNQSNRGMSFEKMIMATNEEYKARQLAIVEKVETPSKNVNGKIVYHQKSTVDFIGMIAGLKNEYESIPVAFEAKQTKGQRGLETSFPLRTYKKDMIGFHQRLFLSRWEQMGGMAFILIFFQNRRECFKIPVKFINEMYDRMERHNGAKSIKYSSFDQDWKVSVFDYMEIK